MARCNLCFNSSFWCCHEQLQSTIHTVHGFLDDFLCLTGKWQFVSAKSSSIVLSQQVIGKPPDAQKNFLDNCVGDFFSFREHNDLTQPMRYVLPKKIQV